MAEEKDKSISQSAVEAAGSLKQAAKLAADVGRVFAGDMSAIKDILTNRLFWEIIISVTVVIALIGMIIGGSITGVLEYLSRVWEVNWEENWTDQAIASNGSMDYLKTKGWTLTFFNTIGDTVKQACSDITDKLIQLGIVEGQGTSDNAQLGDADIQNAGRNPNADDFQNTIQAIENSAALNEALIARIEMIQGRVRQRGLQIQKQVKEQYTLGSNSQCIELMDMLQGRINDRFETGSGKLVLYGGFDWQATQDSFEKNFDTTVFELTELQALKILALFSLQYDCQLSDIDMWSLMDYCGWYSESLQGTLDDLPDSIYQTPLQSVQYGDIGDAALSGKPVNVAVYEMPSLQVPTWIGTCAPQWYYEEIAAIKEHNQQILDADGEADQLWGYIEPEGFYTSNTYTVPQDQFCTASTSTMYNPSFGIVTIQSTYEYTLYENGVVKQKAYDPKQISEVTYALDYGKAYRIIRTAYTTTNSGQITITNYTIAEFQTVANAAPYGTIDTSKFMLLDQLQTYGIVDKLFYLDQNSLTVNRTEWTGTDLDIYEINKHSMGETVKQTWLTYVMSIGEYTSKGNLVVRAENGEHAFFYYGTLPDAESETKETKTGYIVTTTEYYLGLYKNNGIFKKDELLEYIPKAEDMYFRGLNGATDYGVCTLTKVTKTTWEDGQVQSTEETWTEPLFYEDTFTTYQDKIDATVFTLYFDVNINFKVRSIDEIAFDLLGLWPGNLSRTTQVIGMTTYPNSGSYVGYNSANLVGKSTDDSQRYYYYLQGGFCIEKQSNNNQTLIADGTYMTTKRSYSGKEHITSQGKLYTMAYEYAIANTATGQFSEWKSVSADGGGLLFEIDPEQSYSVYMRVTRTESVFGSDGTVQNNTFTWLYQIDELGPVANGGVAGKYEKVENGVEYAAEHFGNWNLRKQWSDLLATDKGSELLTFERMTGHQYESYVDMIMALCELLDVSWSDWDLALKRAEELRIPVS